VKSEKNHERGLTQTDWKRRENVDREEGLDNAGLERKELRGDLTG